MNIYMFLSLLASVIYLCIGIYTLRLDTGSNLNRCFLSLFSCFSLWAFADSFMYIAPNENAAFSWYKASLVGVSLFPVASLHLFLEFAGKTEILKRRIAYIILYAPSLVYIFRSFTGPILADRFVYRSFGWMKVIDHYSLWAWFFMLYYLSYTVAGLIISYTVYKRAKSPKKSRQAGILLITGSVSLFLGTLFDVILPGFLNLTVPMIAPLTIIVWAMGFLYAINRYTLMVVTPSLVARDILNTMADSLILSDYKYDILNVNPGTQKMLGYTEKELIGSEIRLLFGNDPLFSDNNLVDTLKNGPVNNYETFYHKKDGAKIPIILSASEVRDRDGNLLGFIIISKDITALKSAHEQLEYLAHYDYLTGLPNRAYMLNHLGKAISEAKTNFEKVAVLILDLDRFKEINDVMGHNNGDILLKQVSLRLESLLYNTALVARFGGDEFVIIFSKIAGMEHIQTLVNQILKIFTIPFFIDGSELHITGSIGISIYPDNSESADDLIRNADIALYQVKNHGRAGYQLFNISMSNYINEKVFMKNVLRKALEQEAFLLHYQPIYDIATGKARYMEALVRMKHPEFGLVPPSGFIPVAEESGLIVPLGCWVLDNACRQCKEFHMLGFSDLKVSVNLSVYHLQQKNVVENIKGILEATGLDPQYLQLEITENIVINDIDNTLSTLNRLNNLGISISIDDFGMGYSSLKYLKKLPIQSIKIDRFFIRDVIINPDNSAIVSAIFAMAYSMNLDIVVEGIETTEQLNYLNKIAARLPGDHKSFMVQGYLFSEPRPAGSFVASDIRERIFNVR